MTQRQTASAVTTDVFARTVPFLVERHGWGGTRKASMANVVVTKDNEEQADTDKAFLSLRKRLLNSAEIRSIGQRDNRFRELLNNNATPFRPGLFLVPIANVNAVYDAAVRWENDRDHLADVAKDAYPAHVAGMREKLGPLYNALDYPTPERFRATFWVDWRYLDFGVPAVLRQLRKDIFQEEAAKLQRQGTEARVMIEQHLRGSLLEITEHLAALLQPKADGKLPQLKDAALDKLVAFLDTIKARNVTNDTELEVVADRLRALGSGLDGDILREDTQLRARSAAVMAAAVESLKGLVEDAPGRGIRIREEVA